MERHPWRVAEVGAVALAGLVVSVTIAATLVAQGVDVKQADLGWAEAIVVAVVWLLWWSVALALVSWPWGRDYLALDTSDELSDYNVTTRTDSLTIAGLVLAGLALAPATITGTLAGTLLVVAFAAFVAAWSAGFFPQRMSSTLVRDALHWVGLASALGAVFVIARTLAPSGIGPDLAILLATVSTGAYSFGHARAHWRGASAKRDAAVVGGSGAKA
jgi:hypothetical protein